MTSLQQTIDPALVPARTLANGAQIPAIGLGTFGSDHVDGAQIAAAVAILLGWPGKEAVIVALGTASPQSPAKIAHVELLGYRGRIQFRQEASGLRVQMPTQKTSDYAVAFKVSFA